MNADFKLGIAKAFIGATVPTVLSEIFRRTRPKEIALECMAGCVDWDAEYRQLMKEHHKETKNRKKNKARK